MPRCNLVLAAVFVAVFAWRADGQQTYLLNDFNNRGMDVLIDGLAEELGPFAARYFDSDGFGVASSDFSTPLDLTAASAGSLNVRYNPLEGHGTDYFTIDLFDSHGGSLQYEVDTTVPSAPGQFGFYDLPLSIESPSSGSYGDFDFSSVRGWGFSGQPGSDGPFNVNLWNAEIEAPDPPVNYGGRDPNSPWRAEAAQRIDQHRKSDLTLRVTDAAGQPTPGATVRVRQTRQAFQFGTAVAVDQLLGGSANDKIYRDTVLELFNTATLENGLKWQPLAGDWGPGWSLAESVQAIDWLQQNGLESRGHVLIWPGSQNLPSYLDPLIAPAQSGDQSARDQLQQEVLDHIEEVATATDGRVVDWDVVNEIGTNNDVLNIYGEPIMDTWFAAAHEADPDSKLFINEFNIISDDERSKRQRYLKSIQGLVDRGAQIDGIGMQAHFHDFSLTDFDGVGGSDPQTVWDVLDMFHDATGLPITITEFDLNDDNETLKAEYLRDFLTATFAHEAVEGFIMWGFWEGRHWRPDSAMFNQDWSETPAVEVWRDLVLDEWMTDEEGLADDVGEFALRAFDGDYEIVVTIDGEEYTFSGIELLDDLDLTLQTAYAVLPGDFNRDGVVDAADYTVWRDGLGSLYSQPDYLTWRGNYGAMQATAADPAPEATAAALAAIALLCGAGCRAR
ncbi:Endo-1,4-beta-xylanase Z precursor [Posidoniimonas corsicana]|uniref:Beta-xylanase n=1 Tax=Posidoniimonas corsicana TaxID=1938618 RepID=A0A5C5VCS5_9BACT|nr:endo-1,4-beta-xylanase [Posidoniimonas corsicana]TWT36424.1 Endo-1,4-beta-xylanase Z precursor [Posidoniimonas corsicana]